MDSNTDVWRVVLFCSRNKDNKDIEEFKQRRVARLMNCSGYYNGHIRKEFDEFVANGVEGEISRCYISINPRDMKKIRTNFLVWLIEHEQPLANMDSKVASVAAKPECRLTSKWLLDVDTIDNSIIKEIKEFVFKACGLEDVETWSTKNGYAIVTPRGFDTRELIAKYGDIVENKKDGMLLIDWDRKEEDD